MGRGGKKRKNNKQHPQNKKKKGNKRQDRYVFRTTDTLNQNFIDYYTMQKIIAPEEWEEFKNTVVKRLPLTFRINSCQREVWTRLVDWMQTDYFNLALVEGQQIEEFVFEKPKCLSWFPNNLLWQVPVPRKALRKVEGLKKFRECLMFENDIGGVTRQEVVSMIPPLLLDVKPHHVVLDVCAAPGSKTTQILEALHRNENGDFVPFPKGFVVANDADTKRARMLTHQLQRFGSGNFIVMNKFGQCIPKFHYGPMPLFAEPENTGKAEGLLFDRVLVDVPCSGDGTLRKSPELWTNWKAVSGNQIHKEQLKITRRAVQLLKPGGLLVYSTCTFNPLENEAVVSQILRENFGELKLQDTSEKLPGLRTEPGMTDWKVLDAVTKAWYSKRSDVPHTRAKLHPKTMFPPTEAEIESMNLHRCTRVLPHRQDTGGFFICVLKKKKKASAQASNNMTHEEALEEERRCSGSRDPPKDDDNAPYHSMMRSETHRQIVSEIQDFYGLTEDFELGQLVCRSPNVPNHIYLAPKNVARIVTRGANEKLRIVQSGIKAFARQKTKDTTVKSWFRVSQAGAPYVAPFATNQKVNISLDIYKHLLEHKEFTRSDLPQEVQDQLNNVNNGSILLCLQHPDIQNLNWRFRVLAGWTGSTKMTIYVSKDFIKYLKYLIPIVFPDN